jgi:hypothetical protein
MPRPDEISEEHDEDIELPPLDADDDDPDPAEHDVSELLHVDDHDGDALDDAVAGDLDVGGDIHLEEEADLGDEGEDSLTIDVGAEDEGLVGGEGLSVGDDAISGVAAEDDEDFSRLEVDDDDGGTEGTGDPIEDEVDDTALPALDADEEGDHPGENDAEAELGLSSATGAPPVWDAARWEVREGAGAAVPCVAVDAFAGRVLAVGDVMLLVDEGAHAAKRAGFTVPGSAVSVALADGMTAVATARGAVLLWAGGAATPLPGWRASAGNVRVAATPGRLWILCDGALWCSPMGPSLPAAPTREAGRGAVEGWPTVRLDRAREATNVLALAATGGTVVAMTATAAGIMIERMRSDDEGWQRAVLPPEAAPRGRVVQLAASAAGRAIAISDGDAVHVSRDGGVSFRKLDLLGARAVAFIGDGESADLAALVASDVGEIAHLVRIRADGELRRLAEIEPGSGDTEDAFGDGGICWDATREVIWIACRRGLIALGPAPKH